MPSGAVHPITQFANRSRWNRDWVWDGKPTKIVSRSTDEKGNIQPDRQVVHREDGNKCAVPLQRPANLEHRRRWEGSQCSRLSISSQVWSLPRSSYFRLTPSISDVPRARTKSRTAKRSSLNARSREAARMGFGLCDRWLASSAASMPSAWMRTVWVTPRHSRTSRVPDFSEIGGAGFNRAAAQRVGASSLQIPCGGRGEATIRPLLKLVTDPSGQEVAGEPHRRRHAMKPPPLPAQLEDGQLREPRERLCNIDRCFVHVSECAAFRCGSVERRRWASMM